jgi:hypothetical protein
VYFLRRNAGNALGVMAHAAFNGTVSRARRLADRLRLRGRLRRLMRSGVD